MEGCLLVEPACGGIAEPHGGWNILKQGSVLVNLFTSDRTMMLEYPDVLCQGAIQDMLDA